MAKNIKKIPIAKKCKLDMLSTFNSLDLSEVTKGDYRTKGVTDLFHHPEFQCVLPITEQQIKAIFINLIKAVSKGTIFDENYLYGGIIEKHLVEFKRFVINKKEYFRLIFPDANGFYPNDPNCDPDFKKQYDCF